MSGYAGREIVEIRPMTDEEMADEGWSGRVAHQNPPVIVLDDGQLLYPSADPEGNGPGALFGRDGDDLLFISADG